MLWAAEMQLPTQSNPQKIRPVGPRSRMYEPGEVVEVQGLQGKPEHNSKLASIVGWDAARGRYDIRLGGSGIRILIKPDNLSLPAGSAADAAAVPVTRSRSREADPVQPGNATRKRKACIGVPIPVNRPDAAKQAPSAEAMREWVKKLEAENHTLRELAEKRQKGCAAGYARENQLEQALQNAGVPIPRRR